MKDSPFSRRRKPDEIPTARRAIRYFCAECMGWNVAEVRECTDPKCWLYPWRSGTPEEKKRRNGLSQARDRKGRFGGKVRK